MFVGMLEIEEKDRYDFEELYEVVQNLAAQHSNYSIGSSKHMKNSSRPRTPTRKTLASSRTPKNNQNNFRNDVSPFRARFGENIRVPERLGKTPERNRQAGNRSPLRRDLKINPRFQKEEPYARVKTPTQKSMYSPLSRR